MLHHNFDLHQMVGGQILLPCKILFYSNRGVTFKNWQIEIPEVAYDAFVFTFDPLQHQIHTGNDLCFLLLVDEVAADKHSQFNSKNIKNEQSDKIVGALFHQNSSCGWLFQVRRYLAGEVPLYSRKHFT